MTYSYFDRKELKNNACEAVLGQGPVWVQSEEEVPGGSELIWQIISALASSSLVIMLSENVWHVQSQMKLQMVFKPKIVFFQYFLNIGWMAEMVQLGMVLQAWVGGWLSEWMSCRLVDGWVSEWVSAPVEEDGGSVSAWKSTRLEDLWDRR